MCQFYRSIGQRQEKRKAGKGFVQTTFLCITFDDDLMSSDNSLIPLVDILVLERQLGQTRISNRIASAYY
jgi:hypothetical protein